MWKFSIVLSTLICSVAFGAKQEAATKRFQLSKVKHATPKLPNLVHDEPLYAMAVVGVQGKTRVWLVVDSSRQDGDRDILYADLNSNGDLTEKNERFELTGSRFELPEIKDSGGLTHTDVSVSIQGSSERPRHMMRLLWRGKDKMSAGYPIDPSDGYMRFGSSPADAPIVWFNGEGPMQFQRWGARDFSVGAENNLSVFLGQKGIGKKTFTAFTNYVLDEDKSLPITLVYTNKAGEQKEMPGELPGRC